MANGNLGIQDLTEGISVSGAKKYYEDLHTECIKETIEKLNETGDIKNALRAGWQGVACENFIKSLDAIVKVTQNNIAMMDSVLESEINLITKAWLNQDREMVDEAEIGMLERMANDIINR